MIALPLLVTVPLFEYGFARVGPSEAELPVAYSEELWSVNLLIVAAVNAAIVAVGVAWGRGLEPAEGTGRPGSPGGAG